MGELSRELGRFLESMPNVTLDGMVSREVRTT